FILHGGIAQAWCCGFLSCCCWHPSSSKSSQFVEIFCQSRRDEMFIERGFSSDSKSSFRSETRLILSSTLKEPCAPKGASHQGSLHFYKHSTPTESGNTGSSCSAGSIHRGRRLLSTSASLRRQGLSAK